MNAHLNSILNGKDPKALNDIIELNDGTRIKGIILNVGNEQIKYFSGRSEMQEVMPAESISNLYLDDATISIPFPILTPDSPL